MKKKQFVTVAEFARPGVRRRGIARRRAEAEVQGRARLCLGRTGRRQSLAESWA